MMAKRPKTKTPVMTPDDERFNAFEGFVQWTEAVVTQSARMSQARDRLQSSAIGLRLAPQQRLEDHQAIRQAIHAFHTEGHFFAIAAYKLLEYRDWVRTFGLCSSVDFGEVDQFSEQDIKDLRDMREHAVDYLRGVGREPDRWTVIGRRLDWVAFGVAAERLLQRLLAEPIPYPPRP
jgi:hypothetical protein